MDTEERLKWLETRIASSLRPRADELKLLFSRDESRATLIEFLSNDEARRLFVFNKTDDRGGSVKISLNAPKQNIEKCICFVKAGMASQLHAGNFDDAITCLDWSEVLPHTNMFIRDIYLPLLCTDTDLMTDSDGSIISPDKLMDVLHRLLGNLEVSMGTSEGKVVLPLPCIDVLAEAAVFQSRQPAVVHVLESAVVGWIKQIRNLLQHDALAATKKISGESGEAIRPQHEHIMWSKHIEHTSSLLDQMKAPMASDILRNLSHAGSTYAQSFDEVHAEIERSLESAVARLRCFSTVLPWIQDMYRASTLDKTLKVFPPLLHTVLLIWKHSDYYHDPKPFAHLLNMLSNEVVACAQSMVGKNPFKDTHRSYVALKDALRLCAAFRGTYLDHKEIANEFNSMKVESTVITMARLRPKDKNALFSTKVYGPTGYQQWVTRSQQTEESKDEEEQWIDSPWPQRNHRCFAGLSRFVERCNDLLDLVETTRHFQTLQEAAQVGGAGSLALDAFITDIHQVFIRTIKDFTSHNRDVLTIDERQHFEVAFFRYRSVIKTLERRLAGVLRTALRICPNEMSHLRVLEVFEGVSARELLQRELRPDNDKLVQTLTSEFKSVKQLFQDHHHNVPNHRNMPPTVSKLIWVRGLKERVNVPMTKIRKVCPHALESDVGWQLRDAFTEVMNELEKFETKLLHQWSTSVSHDLRDRLKQPVLALEELESAREQTDSRLWRRNSSRASTSNDGVEEKSQPVEGLKVNLDGKLMEMLRDVHHLQRPPHNVPIPAPVRALLRCTNSSTLQSQATRIKTIVSKQNHIVQRMQEYEELLFESKIKKVDELISLGTEGVTWGSADLKDFIEKSSSVICDDVYATLTRIHNNWDKVKETSKSWSDGALDIFTSFLKDQETKSLSDLLEDQSGKDDEYQRKLVPAGYEIHQLLQESFQALEMSAASPAWQLYTAQMDAMVLMSLKASILTSLDAMFATVACLEGANSTQILEVRLELVEQTVSFSPPLDRSVAFINVEDAVSSWLASFLQRSTLINRLADPSSSYEEFLRNDSDVWEIMEEIKAVVQENAEECKKHLSLFDDYKFLWVQDVQQSFNDFLNGRPSPNPLRSSKKANNYSRNTTTTGQRSQISLRSPDAINEAERAFLTSQSNNRSVFGNRSNMRSADDLLVVPGLSDFDEEIGIYKMARDNIRGLPDLQPVGWILFNFQPIKQVLTTYASKWMWTFMKYLSDQVTFTLDTLADFLARIEPEIESITGEERDTVSFMKMMRLFNEVSAQQQDMDGRFSVMQRTVNLLEKYDMRLPTDTQNMFRSAPDRWNHLKTKVALAKQRLGPRIQEESERITRDLLRFSERVELLASELRSSDVFLRDCEIYTANELIDDFVRRLRMLQTEAQDLIELQELLETAVVNFAVLPQHQRDLKNLKLVWHHVKLVQDEQREWKMKQWQKIDTKHLHNAIAKQKDILRALPSEVTDWDVYTGMIASVNIIEQCLPLVEDLNHPAMRIRHWKQLVRVTGGLLQTDTDSLKRMVLGDLLELGLQKHSDEVKAIVQRAVKDLTIETSLKTCEEVWLSKVFELKFHTRGQSKSLGPDYEAGSEMTGSEMMPQALLQTYEGSRTRTKSMKSGIHSRSSDKTGPGSVSKGRGGGRTSVLSLPVSLLNLVDDPSPICLLKNVDKILSDLEHHQVELTRMQSNSAIGSFLDEVTKWQKRLHLIEAVLDSWVTVQVKWVQLDDVYSGADVRTALAHEANMFAVMSKDFRLLMRATEKNTNVLQSCSRKGLLPMLEKMDTKLEQCRHALLGNLERRRQTFPRFYFLSPEDVMNIVCYGYDLDAVNKFLIKILPHLGRLVFDEEQPQIQGDPPPRHASAAIKKKYKVKGIESTAGEVMILSKPLIYEGPMSIWLPQLLASIKTTIQEQLHVALGNEPRPAQIEQTLRSTGASKVRISRPSSAVSHKSGSSQDKMNPTPPQTDVDSSRDGLPHSVHDKPSEITEMLNSSLSGAVPGQQVSWTLNNPTQVVLLSTVVQMNEKMTSALKATSSGDQSALNKVADVISDSLHAAVIMLKGIEDERVVRLRSAYKRNKNREKVERDEESERSESMGAPSTRSSLDGDLFGDDNFNDDVMDEGGQPGPIETMQSLLFTEQMRPGSRGTRGDLDQLEQKPSETGDVATSNDGKLLLFPSQIQKINNLISILTQQRDTCQLMRDLTGRSSQSMSNEIFEWSARLRHAYDKDEMKVSVHALSWQFDYGYEYQGSCSRYAVSPCHDRVLLSMCQALKAHLGLAISSSNFNILSELSYQMGRALYSVLSTQAVDHYMLGDLFKGIAETGCWICFHQVDSLKQSVLSVAGQLAAEVRQALMAGRSAITLMSEEVSLSSHAACFVTFNSAAKREKEIISLNEIIPATGVKMPPEFTENFRIINAVKPDRQVLLEIQLLSRGFTQASQMAKKLSVFLDLTGVLLSTVPKPGLNEASSATTRGALPSIAYRDNASTSLALVESVIASAGELLDGLMREQLELKQEYRETMATKTKKFASIWRHRSSIMSSSGGLPSSLNDDSGGEGPLRGFLSSSSIAPSVDVKTQEVIQVNKDREVIESDVEIMKKMEDVALATALRNVLVPRLRNAEDRSLVATFVVDLWPDAEIEFGLEEEENDFAQESNLTSRPYGSESTSAQPTKTSEPDTSAPTGVENAIRKCKLSQNSGFKAKIEQMNELMKSMGSLLVYGPAGCGKSRALDVYAQLQENKGYDVTTKRVYVNAVDSRNKLFGYYEPDSKEWKDGLIQGLLRPHCQELDAPNSTQHPNRRKLFFLHIDGEMRTEDADILIQILQTASSVPSWLILANNERLCIPLDLRVFWEIEDLSSMTPAVISRLALLGFNGSELSWKHLLDHWLNSLSPSTRSALGEITSRYLPHLICFITQSTAPAHLIVNRDVSVRLHQMTRVTPEAMTSTFCKLVDCLLPQQSDTSYTELEKYIGYCAFWAFGGTLDGDSREVFSAWWVETFPGFFPPGSGDPWHQFVDGETRTLVQWEDHLPQFSGISESGSVFVHTPEGCQLTHLVGALMDAGYPSMLIGPLGCGKSATLRERVNNVSSGEVAEVLSLFVHCNRLTEASGLWSRVSEHLEWKHGLTYTPRGNKKLLCMVDDINLSRLIGNDDDCDLQSACELIRQHMDVGGVRNPSNYKWQQVANTIYVTTMNPRITSRSSKLSERMLRHFSVFACSYPLVATQSNIFSVLLHNHFLPNYGGSSSSSNHAEIEHDRHLEQLLSHLTLITVELQERLRHMYLDTPERAHYTFALGDLERIFRNLMLSLGPDCHEKELLLLWRHECEWTYGRRMTSTVDKERYHQALDTSVRKYLTDNKHLPILLSPKQPIFSNIRELDSGLVTAGRHQGRNTSNNSRNGSGAGHSTDYYKPTSNLSAVHDLLMEALKEFNKVNVEMRMSLYEDVISLVCRMARVMQGHHSFAHSLLFGEGCPVMASVIVNLAGHLGGFRVVTLPPIITTPTTSESSAPPVSAPSSIDENDKIKLRHFKKNIVQLYYQAGVKREKITLLIHDDNSLTNECLAVVEEMVRYGTISHLFMPDEQTTIANSVRSDVTAAGLTYSKDVAWNFFLSTVTKNLRVVLVCSQLGSAFMAKSLEFPSLFSRFNNVMMPHWNHEQLVKNALYHFNRNEVTKKDGDLIGGKAGRGRWMMDRRKQENVAHLLANIHASIKEKDNDKFYKVPGHVCNYAYEKLVERFLHLYNERRLVVNDRHEATKSARENIDRENKIAEVLQNDLDREKQVLDEHKAGTLQLLAQIGQDMVITEQQVTAVRKQVKNIHHLKKSLPEYQVAHEKAVFKAAAIVADTKKVVKDIDVQELSELRSLQKPDGEVEDLMAAIIMILKSPNSDVTWSKGAKRQMANLDRFLDELLSFDDIAMPLSTLETLESFCEKDTFTPENLTAKAGNTAAGSLLKWVQGVLRYHTTMITRVKPLHAKVEQTSSSIGDAQHKLRQLESKKEALEVRLRDLAAGFEQATADKNWQEEKRREMQEHLRVAAKFRQVLAGEHRRCTAVLNSHEDRLNWVVGVATIASAFSTYLAPYPFMFRRMMLTVDWAQCLVDKGIPLVFDSTDPIKGHVIEFMLDVNENLQDTSPRKEEEGDTTLDAVMTSNQDEQEEDKKSDEMQEEESQQEAETDPDLPSINRELPPVTEETDADDEGDDLSNNVPTQPEVETATISQTAGFQPYTASTLPFITNEEYLEMVSSVIRILAGDSTYQEWITKDFADHQLQNAAIMLSSWQRPPLLLDPYLAGADWCAVHLRNNASITPVNLTAKVETNHVTTIEKAILGGHTLMLMGCEHQAGALLRPLIHHSNTTGWLKSRPDDTHTVRLLGRRLVSPESFRLYLTTTQTSTIKFHPDIVAGTQLISYVPSVESLQEDLLLRALQRVRPDIYRERRRVAKIVRQHRHTLAQLDSILCDKLVTGDDPKAIENSTKFLSNVVELKASTSIKLAEAEGALTSLNRLREELFPIAQRGALLYSICRAIPVLNIHYQIPLPFFLHLFDSSVGSDIEEEEDDGRGLKDVEIVHPDEAEELEEGGSVLQKRKASLRLGSAKRTLRKLVNEMPATAEDESEGANVTETEESDSDPAIDDDDGDDVGSHVIVPDAGEVSLQEHDALPSDNVKSIVDELTKRVFSSIYSSIFPEHRLQVTALALLNIQSEGAEVPFTEEELALTIHGNPGFGRQLPFGLEDFDCSSPVPDWLPADRWEDLLAFSILPGSLEGICARVATSSEMWKLWYESDEPEKTEFPESEEEPHNLSDMQRLLLIRTLRPDRYQPALKFYVDENIEGTSLHEITAKSRCLDAETLFKDVSNTLGILVLLPGNIDDVTTRLSMPCVDVIKRLADKYKVSVECVTLGNGYRQEASRCIDTALTQDSWALINGLHLAPENFFEDLQIQLSRVGNISRQDDGNHENSPQSTSQGGHFQVWMTTHLSDAIPAVLTQYLYKISWDSLLELITQDSDLVLPPPESSMLKSCLYSIISKLSERVMSLWQNARNRLLVYVVCVMHAVMVTRHCFGWHGNHNLYLIMDSTLEHAMTHAADGEKNSLDLVRSIYKDLILSDTDQVYFDNLFENLINQSEANNRPKFIELNNVQIPIPPSEMSPSEYASWLLRKFPDDLETISASSVASTAIKWRTSQDGAKMAEDVQDLFNAVQQPGYESIYLSPGHKLDVIKRPLTISTLQGVLDVCLEQLPPLLDLGEDQKKRMRDYDFPYHRPSVVSSVDNNTVHMPESIGFVLLQECICFNRLMCHVLQEIHHLRSSLFTTSDYCLSSALRRTATSLAMEEVPMSWQHHHETPNTHVLLTWLDDLKKRSSQLRSWVKSGIVPQDGKTPVGSLSSAWLGGMTNPGAMILALCQEKAVLHDVSLDDVRIQCVMPSDNDDVLEQEAGIFVEDLYVINARMNDRGELEHAEDSVAIPVLYFYPSLATEKSDNNGVVDYPVYLNMSRQHFVCHLPLPSNDVSRYPSRNGQSPIATDSFVILQLGPDLSNRDTFKSRAYLAQKRRDDWSRVSPAVSEMLSRSGTRMSSRMSGPRPSIASIAPTNNSLKPESVTKTNSPGPDFGSNEQLSAAINMSASEKSLLTVSEPPAPPSDPSVPTLIPPRIPNGNVPRAQRLASSEGSQAENLPPLDGSQTGFSESSGEKQNKDSEGGFLQAILDDGSEDSSSLQANTQRDGMTQ